MKQHTSPFEHPEESLHERAAPPWHWPAAVQVWVTPPPSPPSRAQHTWVPDSHVERPHEMPPPLDAEPPLEVDPAPLLDSEPPLEVDAAPPPFDDAPLDVDAPPPLLVPELPVEVAPDPLPDPDPIRGCVEDGIRAEVLGVGTVELTPPAPDRKEDREDSIAS